MTEICYPENTLWETLFIEQSNYSSSHGLWEESHTIVTQTRAIKKNQNNLYQTQ